MSDQRETLLSSSGGSMQFDVPDRMAELLWEIVNVLGPEPAGCGRCCEGCQAEMAEALRLARGALGLKANT